MQSPVAPWLRIHKVFHPTDMSSGSETAFFHALRVCAAAGAGLTLMCIGSDDDTASEERLDVLGTLARWKLRSAGGEPVAEIATRWIAATGGNAVKSCLQSLERSPAELIVVATEQHEGRMTWLGKSVAESLVKSSGEMTLLVPKGTSGFVRPEDGVVTLKSILIPMTTQPPAEPAIEAARRLMLSLPEAGGTATMLYVGNPSESPEPHLPEVPGWTWNRLVRPGEVAETILETAASVSADLIAMTTQGRHGFLAALRGSTTERVLRQARCPMLTMPVGSFLG